MAVNRYRFNALPHHTLEVAGGTHKGGEEFDLDDEVAQSFAPGTVTLVSEGQSEEVGQESVEGVQSEVDPSEQVEDEQTEDGQDEQSPWPSRRNR